MYNTIANRLIYFFISVLHRLLKLMEHYVKMKFNAHNNYKLPANPSLQVHMYELP